MTGMYDALESLADAYVQRGSNEARVRAKFAEFEKELAEAQKQDVEAVATHLVLAWEAGASVAATGRAMGTSNIYNARRKYYDAAKALQGTQQDVDQEFLERLYNKARGGMAAAEEMDLEVRRLAAAEDQGLLYEVPGHTGTTVAGHHVSTEEWVSTWSIEETQVDGVYNVDEPKNLVDSIVNGLISGYPGNRGAFAKDAELHRLVHEIHDIETKEFD